MRLVDANGKALLIGDDGEVHVPMSLFLNDQYDNASSRETISVGLRLLHVFALTMGIDLPRRALAGQCLHQPEFGWLSNLAFRPIEELEAMTPRMLSRLAKTADAPHRDRTGAVAASTAEARLRRIGEFLNWYFKTILDPRIRSAQARTELKERYDYAVRTLKGKIRGGKGNHPTQIKSLPYDVFVRVIHEAYVNSEEVFCSESGATSPTVKRDRAIFLLGCEGLRPGALGNIALQDFIDGQVCIVDNVKKRDETATSGTPVQKGIRSTKVEYNSEINVTLWPWTIAAINEYISDERDFLLGRKLRNVSRGFLFLESHNAGPIRNRKTIGLVFARAEQSLLRLGLLSRASGDKLIRTKTYRLTAVRLRHSAATLYISIKGNSDQTKSEMKERFGWTPSSNMPDGYGRRANMDAASADLANLWELMQAERRKKLESRQ